MAVRSVDALREPGKTSPVTVTQTAAGSGEAVAADNVTVWPVSCGTWQQRMARPRESIRRHLPTQQLLARSCAVRTEVAWAVWTVTLTSNARAVVRTRIRGTLGGYARPGPKARSAPEGLLPTTPALAERVGAR